MPSFRRSLLLLLTAASAAAQTQPPAADHPDEPVALDSLIVSASPYSRSQSALAQPTSVLAGRQLLLEQSGSLGELLSREPGVSSTYFGPGASRPVIRGLSGDRIRTLASGIGTIDASVISPDHAVAIDPLLIERVEIVRGPAALLYGGNAVGGVVNVIDHRIHTTQPDSALNLRSEVRTSSGNDEKSGGAVLEGGSGLIAWHLDAYRRTAGNVEIPGFAESARRRAAEAAEAAEHGEDPPDETGGFIPNTALRSDGGAAGFSLIGPRGYIGFSASGHNAFYGVPTGGHAHAHHHDEDEGDEANTDPAGDAEHDESVRIDLRQRRLDVQGELTDPVGFFSSAKFKFGFARYRHTELEGDEIGTTFKNHGFDGRVELLHPAFGAFSGAAGWQGSRSDFNAVGAEAFLPPSRTDNHALFVFEEADFNPLAWQLGARLERQAIDLRDGSALSRNETALAVSTGLVWTLDPTWTLGLSLARTERAPNAQELFAHGAHAGTASYEIGDPTLAVERGLALDLTLRKRAGFLTGSLTVFANRFDRYIYEQPTGEVAVAHGGAIEFVPADDEETEGGMPVYRFVQHDATFHGAELETIFHLHHGENRQLDLTLGADFVRARNTTTRSDLPRITPSRVKTGLTWTAGTLSLGGDVQFVAAQNRTAPLETSTGSYALIGVSATYRLTLDRMVIDLFVRGTNLGDEEARMHTSFLKEVAPLPGRSVTLGLRAAF